MKDECIGIEQIIHRITKISWIIIFILVPGFAKSQKNTINQKILFGLSKNYINNYEKELPLKHFLMCYNVTLKVFNKDKLIYRKNVHEFYDSESGMVAFVLKHKVDTLHYNDWIITTNPCLSSMSIKDIYSNSRASIVLLYNYLSFNKKYHIISGPDHLKSKKNVNTMINFCEANVGEKTDVLREKWKKSFTNR